MHLRRRQSGTISTRGRLSARDVLGAMTVNKWVRIVLGAVLGCEVAFAQGLAPTPPDALGPFFPDVLPSDQDNDLAHIAGLGGRAEGTEIELRGRVLDRGGSPLEGVRIELWQTDTRGRYIHSGDPRGAQRDPRFQGFGIAETDAAGNYRFRTVVPGGYGSRPPHLHVRLLRDARELLVTQVYFPGRSAESWLGAREAEAREANQTLRFVEDGAAEVPVGRFDFVLAQ